MQEMIFLKEMMKIGSVSLYDPIKKDLKKRQVNFEPKTMEAFPPKVRAY